MFFATAMMLVISTGAAQAGFFDELVELADPNSKNGKIFAGATQVLSSSQEMDYATECTIGESLALEGLQRFGLPVNDETLQRYVNLVGNAVAANSKRSTIPYRFAVLDSPVQNAFATPGGIVFISKAFLGILDNEAELAAVLAHEVGHVAAKHAISSTRRAQFFQGAAAIGAATMKEEDGQQLVSAVGDMQTLLFDKGLDKDMEFEADSAAMESAYRTGYDPRGMITALQKLKRIESSSTKKGSWFSTHPPLDERIAKLQAQLANYPDAASLATVQNRFVREVKR
jgi:predicted Zn-dependent protease